MEPVNIDDILADPDFYAAAIQKVFDKRNKLDKGFDETDRGVSYYVTYLGNRSLARVMARTVVGGDYRFSPVEVWLLKLRTKTRQAHKPTYTDQIISAVVYQVISQNAQSQGLPGLYSYLPGKSNYKAMQDFAAYVRDYRRRARDPKARALFVLQSDFEKYGDNLPVHDNAFIWKKLRDVIGADEGAAISDNAWQLVRSLVRPVVRDAEGAEFVRLYGAPMGAPIVPMINNLAAAPLDDLQKDFDGAFYARYNDDFLFVHPDRSVVLEFDAKLDALLNPLGVRRNKKKDILSYFNGAGRACEEDGQFRGSSRIDFLGLSVAFDGTMAVGPKRVARLIGEVSRRLDRTAHALGGHDVDAKAGRLVRVTNRMLTPGHSFAVPGIGSILRDTNDRHLLKDIDYRIARKIVQCATGEPGVRGFRRVPMADLRGKYGLMSFVERRNAIAPHLVVEQD